MIDRRMISSVQNYGFITDMAECSYIHKDAFICDWINIRYDYPQMRYWIAWRRHMNAIALFHFYRTARRF